MTTPTPGGSEAARLEALWSGDFGQQYVARNKDAGHDRGAFWSSLLARTQARTVLEVGCNVGANLVHVSEHVPPVDVWGVDVNLDALGIIRSRLPQVNSGYAVARNLPFRDGWFDLTFTVAVLIHVPEDAFALAVGELVRCARRHVLVVEYFAAETTEVNYRDQTGAFFKRDYGRLIGGLFPELTLEDSGELTKAEGFDDGLGWWLFAKP
ncbi:MAG TPA: pseudaminic acid biosynthesis-associated methylase [Acidimicrobiales bacterium]|nr:pseudaminic acid biosynthesis-associated methylase [Acidimicrobiales bacterium]